MQLFSRGVNESLVIGHEVVVTVLEIRQQWVRLGITDPNATPTYWEETVFVDADDDEPAALEFQYAVPG